MPFLIHLLKAVWRARIDSFLSIYALMTGMTAISVVWFLGRSLVPDRAKGNEFAKIRDRRFSLPRSSIAPLLLVGSVLIGYVVLALKWEAFADYDEAFFTLFTLRGRNFPAPIWPDSGRFFPLGDQEFKLIQHFTGSVVGYHALPIAQLLIISFILLFVDHALSLKARATVAAVCLILPSIVYTFTGLVYQERNVVFWLACLVFFVKMFEQTQSTACAVAAAISAQNMIYYKETAFLLLLGFAVGRLILRCRRFEGECWEFRRLRSRESRLDLCLLSVGLLFLLYYASVMFRHPNMQYASDYEVTWDRTVLFYLTGDLLGLMFLATVLRRTYLIVQRRVSPSLLWDGLAFGGVACYAAYIFLRLCRLYYLAPVDFVAVLYVGRRIILSWEKMNSWKRVATLVLVVVALLQSISLSFFHVYERENMLHAKAELADAILVQSRSSTSTAQRLFFPFSGRYLITEFTSYLVYRGLRVEGEGIAVNSVAANEAVIVSAGFSQDKLCVDYRKFVCHAGRIPNRGDLVIELPDDLESNAQFDTYRAGGERVFTYAPRPDIPKWLYPLLGYLRLASYRWRFMPLPDRWLDASITIWR